MRSEEQIRRVVHALFSFDQLMVLVLPLVLMTLPRVLNDTAVTLV